MGGSEVAGFVASVRQECKVASHESHHPRVAAIVCRTRVRLWKIELQKLADQLGLPITVCHLPPGTSKWNKIEHRLFSFITINWRGKPLRSYRTIVQLIAATTTDAGLEVRAELDENKYPKGVKISDAQLAAVNLSRHSFHGDWNYTISPSRKKSTRRKTID